MKILYKLSLFFIAIVAIVFIYDLYSRGGENLPKNFDYGRIENNVYINDLFEMEVELPGSWVVLSKREINTMKKQGHKLYSKDENKTDSVFEGASANTGDLLYLFKYPINSGKTNCSFNMIAEVNNVDTITNGRQIAILMKEFLSNSETKFEFDKEIYKHKFGKNNFFVLEVHANIRGYQVWQEYYSCILKGYTFSIVLSYNNEEQKNELHNIIDKIKFNT